MATVETEKVNVLKWAVPARDVEPTVSLPLLLQALQLLATDEDRTAAAAQTQWDAETPGSMQVIKSGALEITKAQTKLVTRFGGGAGVVAAVTAGITGFRDDVGQPITVALIASAALLLSSVAIALALFVKGDLEARGRATAARHSGRAEVAAAFLSATAGLPAKSATNGASTVDAGARVLQALAAFPGRLKASTGEYTTALLVTNIRLSSKTKALELQLDNKDWVEVGDVTGFEA